MNVAKLPAMKEPLAGQARQMKRGIWIRELFEQTRPERKSAFLNGLKSHSGKTKYKRYMGSPLRYAGGKSLAVGFIIELIPDNIKRVVSPFIGGGSVEVAEIKIWTQGIGAQNA